MDEYDDRQRLGYDMMGIYRKALNSMEDSPAANPLWNPDQLLVFLVVSKAVRRSLEIGGTITFFEEYTVHTHHIGSQLSTMGIQPVASLIRDMTRYDLILIFALSEHEADSSSSNSSGETS